MKTMMTDQNPRLEAQEVESRIITYIERELLSPGETVDREDDLLSGEIFDSIGVLRLAAFVEEDFKLEMKPSDFVIENFQNVAVLAQYILRVASSQ
jgi:acyl carrier protein